MLVFPQILKETKNFGKFYHLDKISPNEQHDMIKDLQKKFPKATLIHPIDKWPRQRFKRLEIIIIKSNTRFVENSLYLVFVNERIINKEEWHRYYEKALALIPLTEEYHFFYNKIERTKLTNTESQKKVKEDSGIHSPTTKQQEYTNNFLKTKILFYFSNLLDKIYQNKKIMIALELLLLIALGFIIFIFTEINKRDPLFLALFGGIGIYYMNLMRNFYKKVAKTLQEIKTNAQSINKLD